MRSPVPLDADNENLSACPCGRSEFLSVRSGSLADAGYRPGSGLSVGRPVARDQCGFSQSSPKRKLSARRGRCRGSFAARELQFHHGPQANLLLAGPPPVRLRGGREGDGRQAPCAGDAGLDPGRPWKGRRRPPARDPVRDGEAIGAPGRPLHRDFTRSPDQRVLEVPADRAGTARTVGYPISCRIARADRTLRGRRRSLVIETSPSRSSSTPQLDDGRTNRVSLTCWARSARAVMIVACSASA